MTRLLYLLLYGNRVDSCKSCETLKEQLVFERDEKKRLTDTLLNIVNPKVVEAAPVEINQITQSAGLFSRRRAALESKDREEAKILRESKHLGKPDNLKDINKLEEELGVEEKEA